MLGFLSKNIKRFNLLFYGTSIVFVCNLLMSFSSSLVVYTILRCFIGFFLGVNIPLILCILTEYLPVHYRSFALSMIWTPFCLGTLYQLLVVYLVMPDLAADKTLDVLFYISFPSMITAIIYFMFLKDSPRNLIINDRTEEAFEILRNIGDAELTQEEKQKVVTEVKYGENKLYTEGSILSMFNPKLFTTTILLILIWAVNAFIYYCPMIIMSLTLKKIGLQGATVIEKSNNDVIKDEVVINLISIIGYFVAGVLSEIKVLGRIYCICIGFFGFAISTFLSFIYIMDFQFFLGLNSIFTTITLNVVCTYTFEIYPTKLRDTAGGFLYFFARLSGFCSQYFGIKLDQMNTFLPYYFTFTFSILGGVLSMLLPYETRGHHLDIDLQKEKDQREIEESKIIENEAEASKMG